MIYKVISKSEFKKFINGLIEQNQTFGPKQTGVNKKGEPIYQFKQVHSFEEMDLDYSKTYSSIKNFFIPFNEKLSEYTFTDTDWDQKIEYHVNPRVIVGVRACDINALTILDKILGKGIFPVPNYIARRKNTFLIGIDHMPLDDCFCESVNHDIAHNGFNLFCTDIGNKYFLKINSSKAFNFLSNNIKLNDPTKKENALYFAKRKEIKNAFKVKMEISGLPSLLDIEFKSPVWKKWGDKCLNCGTCAMVCPTCHCFGIEETIDVGLKKSYKERYQYSCNIVDFAEVAGGHNFRPLREDRLKYRFWHHYRGFAENADEPICVGCNRCGRACLAGINPKEVTADLRSEKYNEM
jgi:formate hydrogenlyase subunit 6/NADH:ubiquinone oxidoreductase subunit I